jgi:anti-sigma B factor antagonist
LIEQDHFSITAGRGADGEHIVVVCGEVDLCNASSVLVQVVDCDVRENESLTLDLSAVTFIDSTGLNVLLHVRDYVLARAVQFSLRGVSREVQRVIELAGLQEELCVRSDSRSAGSEEPLDDGGGLSAVG